MENWLLVASFVLCCQFQNSTLAMMCEKIKVGFHYLNLTYSSYLGISWSKKLEIKIDYNIRLCLIFKVSHLWDASRIWVNATRAFILCFFTILNQNEFRIATLAMFTCDLYAGSPPPHDLERLRTTMQRRVVDFVRVGYFIPLNGPLNGHPPSLLLRFLQRGMKYVRGMYSSSHTLPAR